MTNAERIPADHIDIYGDKAWWVVPADQLAASTALIDRPCDTCGGHGRRKIGNHLRDEHCPDCHGTGRHTFELEVGQPKCPPDCIAVGHIRTLRVSVVPDMVLPIMRSDTACYADPRHGGPVRSCYVSQAGALRLVDHAEQTDTYLCPAPPAARRGMRAVQLEIHG